ncbi:hypothetical protein KTH73_15000 [Acinetobacter courvalinii]|uniref:hypothetical protein n=1 Tax=Acinetobacter courvalinii TaxID=280147 RepID=UPI0021CDA09C|nr:hypothetical protein [Acinetobacter courvalinii]MCU4392026.1 hypothetical protein [Acinetobacter courvalinii]
MKAVVHFNRLFVASEKFNKCFLEEFSLGLNIIGGRNTAGKSTLLQSLLYVIGINDVKQNLEEILEYDPIFRLDFTINNKEYKVVRDNLSIYFEDYNGKISSFNGINSDNGIAHIKLKEFISSLLNFNLMVEQKGEIKKASLECAYLPYYVSQSVGWVYLRESFSNLGFYKGFKENYLDYYLGVNNNFNKEEYIKLVELVKELGYEIKTLQKFTKKPEFIFFSFMDEEFGEDAKEYLENYVKDIDDLQEERNNYIKYSNKLALLKNQYKILIKTKNNLKRQRYNDLDHCPACTQVLSYSLEGLYSYYQKINDTNELEEKIKDELKKAYSSVNNTKKRLNEKENTINENYKALGDKFHGEISFNSWVKGKANFQFHRQIELDLYKKINEKEEYNLKLKDMATDEKVIQNRIGKEKEFAKIFKKYLSDLKINSLNQNRYLDLYKINSFPYQGVELHKTVMAYHFAFNKVIGETKNIHRLPFLLDGILKEDIDQTSLNDIFSFISKNLPLDTQTFISIAEHVKEENIVNSPLKAVNLKILNFQFFKGKAKNIYIGNGTEQRAFLKNDLNKYRYLFNDTLRIIAEA